MERKRSFLNPLLGAPRALESAYQIPECTISSVADAHDGCLRVDTNLYDEALDDFGDDPNDFM